MNRRRHFVTKTPAGETDWSQFMLLPRRPKAAAAGGETPPRPVLSEWIALHHDWIRAVCGVEPEDVLLETATGESMTPTIRNGNVLLVDTTDRTFRSFGIYVLEVDGQRLVKRVQRRHDGSLVLISDNTAYLPDTVEKADASEIEVVGRVVWAGGTI